MTPRKPSAVVSSGIIDNLGLVQSFLQILTWKKLLQLTLFICIMGLSWATYENREVIYGFASQKRIDPSSPLVKTLSDITLEELSTLVEKSDLIVGVEISLADFQKNQRIVIYTYRDANNTELRKLYADYERSLIGNMPLFTTDIADNKYLIDLINGEFSCQPFIKLIPGLPLPEIGAHIKHTCSNGIPASYGRFTGIIQIQLARPPRLDEFDQLRSVSRLYATSIFERDLNK